MEDYYTILNVPPSATIDQIKKSYRKLARKYHPDKNPNKDTTAAFQQLGRAWEHLGDPAKRQTYDTERDPWIRKAATARKNAEASRAREEFLRRNREWAGAAMRAAAEKARYQDRASFAMREVEEAARTRQEDLRRRQEEEELEAHRAKAAREKEEWAAKHGKKNSKSWQPKKSASKKQDNSQAQESSSKPVKCAGKRQEERRRDFWRKHGLSEKQIGQRMKKERWEEEEEDLPDETLEDCHMGQEEMEEEVQAQDDTQITCFRLHDLPPEIVDMIYAYILPRTPNKKRSHAFLRAVSINTQLHSAAMKVYYRINTFEFQVTQGGPLDKTKKEVLEAMTRITFEISSSVIPVTNISPNITAAQNIKHLTLRASADIGLNIIISRYTSSFKKLTTLTVHHKRQRGIANQVYSLFQPKDISQNSIKQNWITELDYMLGESGVRGDDGIWVWTAKGECFVMRVRERHIKFD